MVWNGFRPSLVQWHKHRALAARQLLSWAPIAPPPRKEKGGGRGCGKGLGWAVCSSSPDADFQRD